MIQVLVTRPLPEALHWAQALARPGWQVIPLPLLAIEALADSQALQQYWHALAGWRAVMFVSAQAVQHFFAACPVPGLAWPHGAAGPVEAWATGGGTRAALLARGVPAEALRSPAADAAQFDSEHLWQQVGHSIQPGDRVLIVRGADGQAMQPQTPEGHGRDWLASRLQTAGAEVTFRAAYRRTSPVLGDAACALARAAARAPAVWLFSSSQAVTNLQRGLPEQRWSEARAVVTHPRIAEAALQAGFGVVCTSRPDLPAVAASIESFR